MWHIKTILEVLNVLGSSEHGLTKAEALKRLQENGQNKLPEAKVDSLMLIFFRQFQNPLIYVLLGAGLIVLVMKELIDGFIIIFVIFFNALVGTIQEGRARNTILALKKFVATNAAVVRDSKELIIPDFEVVEGDILILTEGDKVPADARIITSYNLKVDEAMLTGESEPVHKTDEILKQINLGIADQKNIIFKGTHIVSGNGRAVVVATGLNTVLGKIAKEISLIDTEIPLKNNIRYLSRFIIIAVSIISFSLFLLGISFGKSLKEMFAVVVSLSVSIIPEGLPIVVTLVLATGVWRMSKSNVLIKKLQAVEALGQARVIAVDKTGTITKNELVIKEVYLPNSKNFNEDKYFQIGGVGYEAKGDISLNNNIIDPLNHPELLLIGKISAFCTDAHAVYDLEKKNWRIFGDPTEVALSVLARKIGFYKDDLERESPKISEIPFDYKKKYHATFHQLELDKNSSLDKQKRQTLLTVIGAPEIILNLSSQIWNKDSYQKISKKEKDHLESVFLKMSSQGLRILALAIKEDTFKSVQIEEINNLTFVGFVGMKDALRPEVKKAMEKASLSGIRVIMITGDHKLTAEAIAREAGIYKTGDESLTGSDIDLMSDEELAQRIKKTSVFSRVTPEHKLRIINAYRKRGEIIAMTGDGVNDAPSLVAADIGVAMGKIGTEVAKEASDIILLDDNFGSIISGIEEGRNIYKAIKKVILYLFSTSVGEVLTIVGALFLGYPLPILASQIIWLNLVTDSFLDVALGMESKEEGLLSGSFEHPKKYLVDKLAAKRIFFMALTMAFGALFLFSNYYEIDLVKAWTISLTTLAVFQWFNALNCRHETKSIFKMNFFSNKFLVGAFIIVIFLQMLAVYNPTMQKILKTTDLSFPEWLIIVLVAFSIIIIEEIRKFFSRKAIVSHKL